MIDDPTVFDTRPYRSEVLDLSPYEVAIPTDVARTIIRRGAPAQPARTHLTGDEIGMLAVAGAVTGTAIAFIIDPAGAAAALLAIVGL